MTNSRVSLCVLVAALTSAGFSCSSIISLPVQLSIVPQVDPITSAGTYTLRAEVDMDRIAGTVVERVEFYREGTSLAVHTDHAAPYEYAWIVSGDDDGPHQWRARAHVSFEDVNATDEWSSNALNCTVAVDAGTRTGPPPSGTGIVGFIPGIGTANHVAVQDDIAYIASGEFGLATVDVSNPNAPSFLGSADVPFHGLRASVQGSRVIVVGETPNLRAGLWVIDVSQPARPRVQGGLLTDVPQSASRGFHDLALDAAGNTVMAAMGTDGLWVIDVSTPTAPALTAAYDTPGTAYGLTVDGDHVFIADGTNDLVVVDVSNASQPTFVTHKSISGIMRDVAIADGIAYLADQQGALKVLDVSIPNAPRSIGTHGTTNSPRKIAVEDGRAVLYEINGLGNALEVFDVSTPSSPELIDSVQLADGTGFSVSGHLAFVAEGDGGVQVYDVRASAPPLGGIADVFEARTVAFRGDRAVIGASAQTESHFVVVNTQTLSEPYIEGTLGTGVPWSTMRGVLDLVFDDSGDFVVAAMGEQGLWVIDVSVTSAPRLAGSYDTPGTAYGVAVDGSLAYVADGTGDLQVIDISDPGDPRFVASKSLSGLMRGVALLGDFAYLADQQGGLKVVDITDPTAPRLAGLTGTTGFPRMLAGGAGKVGLLEATSARGAARSMLEVFNVSVTPTAPQWFADIDLDPGLDGVEGHGKGATVYDGLAFIAQGSNGVKAFDLSTADVPEVFASPVVGHANDIAVDGDYAYVADSVGILTIVNVRE